MAKFFKIKFVNISLNRLRTYAVDWDSIMINPKQSIVFHTAGVIMFPILNMVCKRSYAPHNSFWIQF